MRDAAFRFVAASWLLLTLALLPVVVSDTSDVVTLTDSNFDGLTKEGSWMIEFYAPWCGHCKALAPTWEKAATEMKGKIHFGKVDCTAQTAIATRYGIRGYPTLKFMRDGELRAYTGSRSLQDLVSYSTRMAATAVHRLTPSTDVASLLSPSTPTLFVLVSSDPTPHPDYSRVAHQMQGLTSFYHLPDPTPSFLSSLSLSTTALPTLLRYTLGRPHPDVYPHPLSSSSLRPWVEAHRLPLISSLSGDNFEDLTTTPRTLALLVGDEKGGKLKPYTDALYEVADRYRGVVSIATVDVGRYGKWVSQFVDVEAGKLPALVAFQGFPDAIYKPDHAPMSLEEVKRMIEDIVDGRRSAVNSIPWYHPSRYLRPVERWFGRLSDTQLLWGVVGISMLVCAAIAYFTLTSPSTDGSTHDRVTRATEAATQSLSEATEAVKAGATELKERVQEAVEAEKRRVKKGEDEGQGRDEDEDEDDEREGEDDPVTVPATAVPRKTRSRKEY